MENSVVQNKGADEAVLEALLEDAKNDSGEAGLEALLAKADDNEGSGEGALEALLAKADDSSKNPAANKSAQNDRAARQKARQERHVNEVSAGASQVKAARAAKKAVSHKAQMLIVHADTTQLSVLEMSFISEGYDVITFQTGKEGLNFLKTNVPDIMVLDADMEKLTGMDICFRIRKIKRFETVPVIIMTEANDDKTETMVKMCHANDYFPKANKNIELKAKVRKLLDKSDIEKLTKVDVDLD